MTTITTYPLVEVRAYRNMKEFETDAQRRLSAGWTMEGQSGDSGHVGLGGAAAGYLIAGLPGMIGMQGMRKGKTMVTWMHHGPSAWQVRACEARRAGKRKVHIDGGAHAAAAWFWGITVLASLVASAMFPPLLILTLAAVICLAKALRGGQDIAVAQAY